MLMVRFHFVQVVVSTMLHPTVLASQTGGVGKAAEVALLATTRVLAVTKRVMARARAHLKIVSFPMTNMVLGVAVAV